MYDEFRENFRKQYAKEALELVKIGKEAGLVEGKSEGEEQKAINIAKEMLNQKLDVDLIA